MNSNVVTLILTASLTFFLVGCDANTAVQKQDTTSPTRETLNLKDFEPGAELRRKARQYAKRESEDGESDARSVAVKYVAQTGPTLEFESHQEFKAYSQAHERISNFEGRPLQINETLKKYQKYPFVSKGGLHALNHKQQVVINDTLYRLRGKKQIEIPLDGGEKEVTMLSEMRPKAPEFEYASRPPSELPMQLRSRDVSSKASDLGQCVDIIGWRGEDGSKSSGDLCYVADRQTRYYTSSIDLPDGALSYDGDPIYSILLRPLNYVSPGSSGFLGQTDRLASAYSKVYLYGSEQRYELGVDGLAPDKLTGDVVVDIRLETSEESCYFGYCYCTDDNIVSDIRSVIALTDVGYSYTTINTTGSDAGDYALSTTVDDRCGGKSVTSWHGVEVDGRQYPTYHDGRLFTDFPDTDLYTQHENSDVIYKVRGGCGENEENCGARPGERL